MMMRTLRFWKRFLIAAKLAKNAKVGRHVYAEIAYTWRHCVNGFYTLGALTTL